MNTMERRVTMDPSKLPYAKLQPAGMIDGVFTPNALDLDGPE